MDGTLIVYDKERDDAAFVPEETSIQQNDYDGSEIDHMPLHVNKSVNSKNQKANPVASWKISNHRINGFAFSPDSRHLAVVSEDGSLRIINYLQERLVGSLLDDLHTHRVCWLTILQPYRSVHELLWWIHVRLLVPGWEIHLNRWTRRFSVDMVAWRTSTRGPMSGTPFLGYLRGFRSLEMR